MIVSLAAAALAAQLSMAPEAAAVPVMPQTVQYRVRPYPPPCGDGWDLSARDGLCYPNGYLPPQEQAARQRYHRGGRYPVPCGNGADLDSRDGLCYPTGTVPLEYQEGRRQRYYGGDGYYRRAPRGQYYQD